MRYLIPIIVVVFTITGCVKYQQMTFQPADLSTSKRFEKNIKRYNVIVHKDGQIGTLENQEIVDNSIVGKARFTPKDSIVERPVTKESTLRHRKDVHLYMKPESNLELPESRGETKNVEIRFDEVKEIRAFTSNEDKIIGTVFIVLGAILLGFLLLILLFILIVTVIILSFLGSFSNKNNNNTNTGGGSNSGGSGGSNSGGSNSGGSNSGGSNSGGSNGSGGSGGSGSSGSSSGCYIATMAYGDYDHPQVMELRRFRDETLAQSKGGRKFIQLYYKYSPKLVEQTKGFTLLHRLIRGILNGLIRCLPK
ncbi:MAG: hypothetical protein KJ941_01780 [Bacteroidetes bacterium]|nr:hypothetical protein [Bacteroidota bacterium]